MTMHRIRDASDVIPLDSKTKGTKGLIVLYIVFLPKQLARQVESEIAALGDEVLSDQVFTWVTDAEHNKPYLKGSGRDAFGNWKGDLVTGEGWRELQNFGLSHG